MTIERDYVAYGADVTVEAYRAAPDKPLRVRLDAWGYGDGASMYMTAYQARQLALALTTAASAVDCETSGTFIELAWKDEE